MSDNLTHKELKKKYSDVLANDNVMKISEWTEPNTDIATDEAALRNKILKNLEPFTEKIEGTLRKIKG